MTYTDAKNYYYHCEIWQESFDDIEKDNEIEVFVDITLSPFNFANVSSNTGRIWRDFDVMRKQYIDPIIIMRQTSCNFEFIHAPCSNVK